MRAGWLPWTLLLLILAGGSYVRIVGLGGPDFYNDELYIVYSAQALDRGDGPMLPSGESYRRGLDIIRMVGLALRHAEHPETAARLPAAAFGILGLILFASAAWAMAGPWAAVWCALLLAIYPEAISQSRITRFYTYQLMFGLVAFYAGWRAVRSAGLIIAEGDRRRVLRTEWGWTVMALVAFALAARVQPTTLSVAAGWAICVAAGGAADLARRGRGAWRYSARVQAAIMGLVALATVALAAPGTVQNMLDLSRAVPQWAGGVPGDPRGYYWALMGTFPVIIALLPLCIVVTAFHNARLAAFLAIWFAVPFAVHSFVLAWKAERFILLAMPAFFMLAAVPAVLGAREMFTRTRHAMERAGTGAPLSRLTAAAMVAVVTLGALVATPAFNSARKIPPFVVDLHWRTALEMIHSLPEDEELVFGSTYPINSLHYWGRVDFGVSTASLERPPVAGDSDHRPGPWVRYQDGVPDYYTAIPVITQAAAIRNQFAHADAAVIAIDRADLLFGHLDSSLAEALAREATELCKGTCGRLLLYYWPWGPAAEPPPVSANAPTRGAVSPLAAARAGAAPR